MFRRIFRISKFSTQSQVRNFFPPSPRSLPPNKDNYISPIIEWRRKNACLNDLSMFAPFAESFLDHRNTNGDNMRSYAAEGGKNFVPETVY